MRRRSRRRGDDRRQVADRVAPALVQLDRLDDDLGRAGRRASRALRGDAAPSGRRPPTRRRAPGSSPRSRPRARSPMTSPPLGGSSASSNACAATIDARRRSAARPPGSPRAGSRPTASAACSLVPQPVTTIGAPRARRLPDRAREPPGRRPADRPAARGSGAARYGSAAIMSVMWYGGPVARRGLRRRRPGLGARRRGERSGRRRVRHRLRIGGGAPGEQDQVAPRDGDQHPAYNSPLTKEAPGAGWSADPPGLEGRVRRLGRGRGVGENRGPRAPRGGARLRVGVGLRSLHDGPGPDRRDHVRVVLDAVGAGDGHRAGPPRPHGHLHRVPQPGPHGQARRRRST